MRQLYAQCASGGGSTFVCNICLGTASDAVVTICGHLFCWPCLTRWLTSGPNRKICAVCKAAVDNSKIIPIYGRNSTRPDEYARDGLAPRPTGGIPAPPPRPSSQFVTITFCNGLNVSLGYGNFPFGLIRISFNYVEREPEPIRIRNWILLASTTQCKSETNRY
ncbi:E3 ubiquitin-protein ligase RNF185-like [Drosophila obscura]|uniref:E3 ubiquitin-protein ligase RNF185-like n=1 Tax=Drosophila obscura TaxID=7282 RepID=UPI001BB18DBB|nr:E3 ubiquitin-protein ligase RNF185-like [Drosophila obscura]